MSGFGLCLFCLGVESKGQNVDITGGRLLGLLRLDCGFLAI